MKFKSEKVDRTVPASFSWVVAKRIINMPEGLALYLINTDCLTIWESEWPDPQDISNQYKVTVREVHNTWDTCVDPRQRCQSGSASNYRCTKAPGGFWDLLIEYVLLANERCHSSIYTEILQVATIIKISFDLLTPQEEWQALDSAPCQVPQPICYWHSWQLGNPTTQHPSCIPPPWTLG